MKISETVSAMAVETSVLVAMTPPNALVGSQAWAWRCTSATSVPTAIPHGFACLMIATQTPSWSCAARQAASVST